MRKKSLSRLPPNEDTLHHHLDRVSYLSLLLKRFELNHHSYGKCRPVRYAVPATADVLQPQLQVLSDDDDGSDGEY